jgi:uncharacterized protein (TIGR02231 family)
LSRTKLPAMILKCREKTFMKKSIYLLILFYSPFVLNAEDIVVKSTVKEVIVFLKGASVTNIGTQNLNSGSHDLIFENLSPFIDPGSIQVKGEGNFTILGIKFRTNYLGNQAKPKEIKNLEDSLETLQNKLELIKGQRSAFENEELFLLSHKNIGGTNTGVNANDLEKVANMLRNRLPEIKSKIIEYRAKEKKLNESILIINNQLTELNSNRNRNTGEVVVSILANNSGTAKIKLNYNVSNAGWFPIYDIRAIDSNSAVNLEYRAMIFQNTGDDWKSVKLTLSTGNPTLNGEKPDLQPWWIEYFDAYQNKKRSESLGYKPQNREQAAPSVAQSLQKEETAADYAYSYTTEKESQTNFNYEISIPYDIPSDGKEHSVIIKSYSIPAKYKYYSVPKIDKDAFLIARISGWEQYNLISGEANVFFEGTFVGKSFLNTAVTNDTLEVSLGRDKNIVVTREILKDLSEKKFIGNSKKETKTYEIHVRNKKNKDIEIQIEDQLPLSRNQDMEIEINELSEGILYKDNGLVTWNLKGV